VRGKKDSERDKNKKIHGEEEKKKTTKRGVAKKSQFFSTSNDARKTRPMTPTKKALRAALLSTSTSGKALHDEPLTTFASI
jgi:hypothetical protein